MKPWCPRCVIIACTFYRGPYHGSYHNRLIAKKVCVGWKFKINFSPAVQSDLFNRRFWMLPKSPAVQASCLMKVPFSETRHNGHPVLIQCSPYRTKNYKKILGNSSRTPGRICRQQSPKYEAEVLTSTLSLLTMLLLTNINIVAYFLSRFVTYVYAVGKDA